MKMKYLLAASVVSRSAGVMLPATVKARIDDEGRYVYEPIFEHFGPGTRSISLRDPFVTSSASLWKIQLGIAYEF